MNARCRTARVLFLVPLYQNRSVNPAATNGFEFSIDFLQSGSAIGFFEIPFCQVKCLPVHLDALLQTLQVCPCPSRNFPPSRPSANRYRFSPRPSWNFHRKIVHTSTKPISVSVELSLLLLLLTAVHSLRRFWMLPAPLWTLPVVPRSHRSFRSLVPNSVLQVAVVQMAVALAEAVMPSRCYCCFLAGSCFEHPMLMAREAASLRPQGDVSCAEAPHLPVP